MDTLFRDEFFPATKRLGFLRSPADAVVEAYAEWHARLGTRSRAARHDAPLRDVMPLLEPLTVDATRTVVATTREDGWTAILTNFAPGGDPVSALAVLSKMLHTDGLLVGYSPDVREEPGVRLGRLGARVFTYTRYDPDNERPIAPPTRSIYLARQSGSRWLFEAKGEPLDFEDEDSYRRRRVEDRFAPETLVAYCRALGLDPFDEDFYPGPCFLVERDVDRDALATVTTFEEQQRKWQITPQR